MPRHTHAETFTAPAFTSEGDPHIYDARTGAVLPDYRGLCVRYLRGRAELTRTTKRGGRRVWRVLKVRNKAGH